MSKAAIKKRNQRNNWSDEKRKAVNAKKAEKQRKNYAKLEDDKKAPKKEANKLRMRENRAAEKSEEVVTTSPSAMSSNDEDDTEEMSEYEKLRLKNIQERNEKFKNQFGIPDPNLFDSKHAKFKSCKDRIPTKKATSEENYERVFQSTTRTIPKRKCNSKTYNFDLSDENSEEEYITQDYRDDLNKKSENMENGFENLSFAEKLISILTRPVYKPLQNCYFIQKESVTFDNLASLCDDFDMPPLSYPAHLEFLYDELSEYYQKHKKSVLGRKTKDAKRKAEERRTESGYDYDLRMAENSERLEFETVKEWHQRLDKQIERNQIYRQRETKSRKVERHTADVERHRLQEENGVANPQKYRRDLKPAPDYGLKWRHWDHKKLFTFPESYKPFVLCKWVHWRDDGTRDFFKCPLCDFEVVHWSIELKGFPAELKHHALYTHWKELGLEDPTKEKLLRRKANRYPGDTATYKCLLWQKQFWNYICQDFPSYWWKKWPGCEKYFKEEPFPYEAVKAAMAKNSANCPNAEDGET